MGGSSSLSGRSWKAPNAWGGPEISNQSFLKSVVPTQYNGSGGEGSGPQEDQIGGLQLGNLAEAEEAGRELGGSAPPKGALGEVPGPGLARGLGLGGAPARRGRFRSGGQQWRWLYGDPAHGLQGRLALPLPGVNTPVER